MRRLSQLTDNYTNKHTAGRYLQALALAKGNLMLAEHEVRGEWLDRGQIVAALKAAVPGLDSGDMPAAMEPIAESFLAAMRDVSVPLRLQDSLRLVASDVRIYVNGGRVLGVGVAEGAPIPVLRGSWDNTILRPRAFAAIAVQTLELAKTLTVEGTRAFISDLLSAVAEAENNAFVSPWISDSVLEGTPNFASSGSAVANIDTDLAHLVELVPGAFRPGTAFVMCKDTATFLGTRRGTGGAAAYPGVGPLGGELLGVPVLITSAAEQESSPPTRIIGLIDANEIFYLDDGVELTASQQAALQMDSAPTNEPTTPTATTMVSMWQAGAVALRGVRRANWYARVGAGAYFTAGY